MIEPPGQRGLVERLDHLERRIDELTQRSAGHGAPIGRIEATTATPTLTFDNIPLHYHSLQLDYFVGTTAAGWSSINLRFNGRTTGYDMQYQSVAGTGVTAGRYLQHNLIEVGVVGAASWGVSAWGNITIGGYADEVSTYALSMCAFQFGGNDFRGRHSYGWMWGYKEPVTSVSLSLTTGSFAAGATARLYGMR